VIGESNAAFGSDRRFLVVAGDAGLGTWYSSLALLEGQHPWLGARERLDDMAEGTIKRLTDKGFGFIETSPGKDIFFHMSAVEGVRFEDLKQGQRVSFNEGQGPKGPRAENVKVI
jgi:CspA family cold shock protein